MRIESNCDFMIWAPGSPRYGDPGYNGKNYQYHKNNFDLSNYDCSLFNIGKDLAETRPRSAEEQEEICNRWGRSLDDLTDDERTYIEQVCGEFNAINL